MTATTTRKAIQAGDYGVITPHAATPNNKDAVKKDRPELTDGRKVLSLWGSA